MQQSKPFSLTMQVASAGKQLLQPSDFTYLGGYSLGSGLVTGAYYGKAIAHRYVSGQLRFLAVCWNSANSPQTYDILEFSLPSGGFGGTVGIGQKTNTWPSAAAWAFRSAPALTGHHYGFWYEDQGGGSGRLWQSFGVDYPGSPWINLCEAVATCTLNSNGTVNNYKSAFGFQGVSQRCVMGRVQPIPAWFQSQYGVGPYLYGSGGYASLMAQGGLLSMGLFALAGPDVSSYTPPATYPPAGYANNGSDWSIPTSAFKILADHRSGTSTSDWYSQYTGPGFIPPFDCGQRLNGVQNYYCDGNQPATTGTATFTHGSATVTFSVPQTLNAGDWIGPPGGATLTGVAGQVVSAAVAGSLTATLTAAYTGTTVTAAAATWIRFVAPPAPPAASGKWLSPAPDGVARWPWGDSYFGSMNWIDGPTKSGLTCVLSGSGGKCWYEKPGNFLGSDSGVGEIHIFDPADFGKVLAGTKQAWNVQPSGMLDITPMLISHGYCTQSHNNETNGPCAATFDAVTNTLWIYSYNGGGARLDAYEVNC